MIEERDPHHPLNAPAENPDETEWPDPYDKREDPRGPGKDPHPGDQSTSEPPPREDPEAEPWEGPKRDKLDE
jgi:hypothetical protein